LVDVLAGTLVNFDANTNKTLFTMAKLWQNIRKTLAKH
jgi:hypothetical protein